MTREEAKREIDFLDYYLQNHTDDYGEESHTAMMMAIQALEQEPSGSEIPNNCEMRDATLEERESIDKYIKSISKPTGVKFGVLEQEPSGDAVSRDFQIGDEVRIIGSDPIYDDCDVGWVIRNASERVKTMYVMRNDGSADEENKAEWYKTGRHNAMLAEVIKQLPSVKPQVQTGHWIDREEYDADRWECSECGRTEQYKENYCPSCGAKMSENTTSSKPEISSYYGLKSYVRERSEE